MGKLKDKVIYGLTVLLFLFFTLGPIIWCIIISITPESEMLKASSSFLPNELYFGNYQDLFTLGSKSNNTVFTGIKNSLNSELITVFLGTPISVLTGYALARYKFKMKKFFLKGLLLTITIPVFTTIIPIYAAFANLELLDNMFWMAIIYVSAFVPWTSWILMNYFKTIPQEIWEAAEMDGCSEFQIFTKIVLPLSLPIIFTCILMIFIMSWNQFQIPLILTSSVENKVVTLVLSEFMTRYTVNYGMIAAAGLISVLPPALVAILFRRFLISGLTSGAVKG